MVSVSKTTAFNIELSRDQHLAEKIVFVDGLWGCGKTMLSSIIAAYDRVELLTYCYEIEHLCALYFLEKINLEPAALLIRMFSDLKLYNTMMGREVNFRPSDLSSVFKNSNPARYFERLFGHGDERVPDLIKQVNPILHYATHNVLAFSDPIYHAIGNRAIFIEMVRHPLYMLKQQTLNMEHLLNDVRDFTVYYKRNNMEYPYFVKGWESEFSVANPIEKSILYIKYIGSLSAKKRFEVKEQRRQAMLTIPFEGFVKSPNAYLDFISNILETKPSQQLSETLFHQNVPRDKVGKSIDIQIYRRCGWEPPADNLSEREILLAMRDSIKDKIQVKYMDELDELAHEYEMLYWNVE